MKKEKMNVVEALRYNNRENHSYVLGVSSKKQKAIVEKDKEDKDRGGKYTCVISEMDIDTSY